MARSARQIAVAIGCVVLLGEAVFALNWSRRKSTEIDVSVSSLAVGPTTTPPRGTGGPSDTTPVFDPALPFETTTSFAVTALDPTPTASSTLPTLPPIASTTAVSSAGSIVAATSVAPAPASQPTSTTPTTATATATATTPTTLRHNKGPWVIGAIVNASAPAAFGTTLARAAVTTFGVSARRVPIRVETCDGVGTVAGATACARRFVQEHVDGVLGTLEPGANEVLDALTPAGIAYIGMLAETQRELSGATSVQLSTGLFGSVVGPVAWAKQQRAPRRLVLAHRTAQNDAASFVTRAATAAGVAFVDLVMNDDGTLPANAPASTPADATVALVTPGECRADATTLAPRAAVLFLPVACVDARYRPTDVSFYVASPFTLADDRPIAETAGSVVAENLAVLLRGKPTNQPLLNVLRAGSGDGVRLPPFNCAVPPQPSQPSMCSKGVTIVRVGGSPATFRTVGGWIPVDLTLGAN